MASTPSLAGVVPAAPQWPEDRLPKSLTDEDLRAVLAHFDVRTATGRRDLAMMRCMSDLGLRVSEVVALTLDDIDWRRGVVTIRGGKGRRGRALPLPAPLGRAIAAYLRDGRPSSADRHLFLRHTVPVGTPVTHDLIRGVFRRAYAAATGRTGSVGTHVLRHTAAARMRAAGHSLKGIADVLGHRSVDTTAIYVKLDVEALRAVALPWPGGAVMSAPTMADRVEEYLAYRRALGYQTPDRGADAPVVRPLRRRVGPPRPADDRARPPLGPAAGAGGPAVSGPAAGGGADAGRATWRRASPAPRSRPEACSARPTPGGRPSIYSEADIAALIAAARSLAPADGLRPRTYATLIGLMACTGLADHRGPDPGGRRRRPGVPAS